jgi:hypothetical protein
MALGIRKFNMRDMLFDKNESNGPVVVMLGMRGNGKTYLVKDLLFYHQDVPIMTVISGTEAGNGFYKPLVPKMFIHHEYSPELITNVLLYQKKVLRQIKHNKNTFQSNQIDPRTIVLFDDCLYDDKWTRDRLMRCLFMNGRHWKVMLIVTMQYCMGIPPILRGQIDYVFILRENKMANRRKIYENYASIFPTFEAFCTVLDQTTENYECLVINNIVKSNRLMDQIFWYKAEPHNDFRLCLPKYWEISDQQPDSEEEEEYNPAAHRKKNTPNLVVVKQK